MNDPYFNVSETNQACLDIDIDGGFQVDPAAELHQGAQGDLHQREGQPQEGDFVNNQKHFISSDIVNLSCWLLSPPPGEEAGGEGVVLQALRPQEPLHQARSQPVLLKLALFF